LEFTRRRWEHDSLLGATSTDSHLYNGRRGVASQRISR
jgi:hypothetical protein